MGRPAKPFPERILAAIESAGRPLCRSEILGWYITCGYGSVAVQAELDRMVVSGELVAAGTEPRGPRDPFKYVSGPWHLYGLTPRRQIADNPSGDPAREEWRDEEIPEKGQGGRGAGAPTAPRPAGARDVTAT